MKKINLVLAALAINLVLTEVSQAGFTCKGPMTLAQIEGIKTFFSPKFSPSLKHVGGKVESENFYKVVSSDTLAELNNPKPQIAAEAVLDATNAGHLKGYLNANASREVPGFIATSLSIFVPAAWVGITADVAIQIINSSGSAGKEKLANIAGTVSENGRMGVIHRIAKSNDNKIYYIWNYVYSGTLNGKSFMYVLESCRADVRIS